MSENSEARHPCAQGKAPMHTRQATPAREASSVGTSKQGVAHQRRRARDCVRGRVIGARLRRVGTIICPREFIMDVPWNGTTFGGAARSSVGRAENSSGGGGWPQLWSQNSLQTCCEKKERMPAGPRSLGPNSRVHDRMTGSVSTCLLYTSPSPRD